MSTALDIATRSIIGHEGGFVLTVYDDHNGQPIKAGVLVKGKPTIGVGVRLDAPGGLSREECELLLANRLRGAHAAAQAFAGQAWAECNAVRQAVLVEMAFQLGRDGLFGFRVMRGAVQVKAWGGAAGEMLRSQWHEQTPERCEVLSMRMRTGTIEA